MTKIYKNGQIIITPFEEDDEYNEIAAAFYDNDCENVCGYNFEDVTDEIECYDLEEEDKEVVDAATELDCYPSFYFIQDTIGDFAQSIALIAIVDDEESDGKEVYTDNIPYKCKNIKSATEELKSELMRVVFDKCEVSGKDSAVTTNSVAVYKKNGETAQLISVFAVAVIDYKLFVSSDDKLGWIEVNDENFFESDALMAIANNINNFE